jgi:hypothetical protein
MFFIQILQDVYGLHDPSQHGRRFGLAVRRRTVGQSLHDHAAEQKRFLSIVAVRTNYPNCSGIKSISTPLRKSPARQRISLDRAGECWPCWSRWLLWRLLAESDRPKTIAFGFALLLCGSVCRSLAAKEKPPQRILLQAQFLHSYLMRYRSGAPQRNTHNNQIR